MCAQEFRIRPGGNKVKQTTVPEQGDLPSLAERAIAKADMNVLRVTLYQLTHDPELAAIPVVKKPIWGGVMMVDSVAEESHALIRRKALEYLQQRREATSPPPPAEAHQLMDMFTGDRLNENQHAFGYEELAFEQFPRGVDWTHGVRPQRADEFPVVIIGAGISGIAMGIQLARLGIDFVIYERQSELGGTWALNKYPSARVDITSFLYQFKFEKNYPWREFFSTRQDTLVYLNHIVDKYGIRDRIHLNVAVESTLWDEASAEWNVTLQSADGTPAKIRRCKFLVSASGLFSTPLNPDIPGIDTFKGAMFHTTSWDQDFSYAGKRVALIGNGSTGTQLMPAIAEAAASLTAFQRTPQWIFPMENYRAAVPEELRWLFENLPYYWNWFCYSSFTMSSRMEEIGEYDPEWQRRGGLVNERNDRLRQVLIDYINGKVHEKPELASKLTPNFAPMARRPIVDNGWYDALARPNVELVTESIDSITPNGIRTSDGRERCFDLIVLAAGFQVSKFLWPVQYIGRDGATLEQLWEKDGARAFLGLTMPGFPNFFMLYGPNSQARGGGFYSWAEIWCRFITRSIIQVIEGGHRSIEVKRDAFDRYNAKLDRDTDGMIRIVEGKGSYYINEYGRLSINVPWAAADYHAMVSRPDPDDMFLR